MWAQLAKKSKARLPKSIVNASEEELAAGLVKLRSPKGPVGHLRMDTTADGDGFTLEMTIQLAHLLPGQVLLDARDGNGRGLHGAPTGVVRARASNGRGPHSVREESA